MPTSLIVIVRDRKKWRMSPVRCWGGAEIKVNVSDCQAVCLKTRPAYLRLMCCNWRQPVQTVQPVRFVEGFSHLWRLAWFELTAQLATVAPAPEPLQPPRVAYHHLWERHSKAHSKEMRGNLLKRILRGSWEVAARKLASVIEAAVAKNNQASWNCLLHFATCCLHAP